MSEIPTLPTIFEEAEVNDEPDLREELIHLAEVGDIEYTTKYIKKASRTVLERVKRNYIGKQANEANEFLSDSLIAKFSELMSKLEMVDESGNMENELHGSKLLNRDLKKMVGHITPYIPLVGLLCGGVIVGKHVISNRYSNKDVEHKQTQQCEQED